MGLWGQEVIRQWCIPAMVDWTWEVALQVGHKETLDRLHLIEPTMVSF